MERIFNTNDYNQLITQFYFSIRDGLSSAFPKIDMGDYVMLHVIAHLAGQQEAETDRVYVKQLSEYLEMTVAEGAALARALSERGLVEWTHDPENLSAGAYVKISEYGQELLQDQSDSLKETIQYVRDQIGMEKLMMLLQTSMEIRNLLKLKNVSAADA